MVDQSVQEHIEVLQGLTDLCAQEKLSEFTKVLTIGKRKKFMDFISDYENDVGDEFRAVYLDFLDSIHNKINPKIFEIILRIGVNFMNDDSFWFQLINILDYGDMFDQQEVLFVLIDQVLKQDENSWKATCLLCILIQDYPNMKTSCTKNLIKIHEQLYAIFHKVEDFASASYLVELISQLESKPLVSLIFKDTPNLFDKFPKEACYANDDQCLEFLKQIEFDNSIFNYQSCKIGDDLNSARSHCQITSKYLIALLDHNDFASPIQFDLPNIKNVKQDGKKVIFNLSQSVKKALINADISQFASVYFEFGTKKESTEFFKRLNDTITKNVVSTPRKISVVQNFIALTGGFGDAENESDIHEGSQEFVSDENEVQAGKDANNTTNSNSGIIDESESIFGSPINTTKDTSIMRKGRAVSMIVADSKGGIDNGSKKNPLAFLETPSQTETEHDDDNYEQVPDSMDEAFKTFRNPPINRGPSDVVIDSEPITETNKAQHAAKKNTESIANRGKSDIWDFDSDPAEMDLPIDNPKATSTVNNSKYRSKAMKCLTTIMTTVEKTRPAAGLGKSSKKPNQVVDKTKVNTKLQDSHKNHNTNVSRYEQSSIDTSDHNNDSFKPLTSPLVGAHERARTRAYSKAMSAQQESPIKNVDNGTKKRKAAGDDESYHDEDEEFEVLPSRKTRKTGAKKKAKEPVKSRNTRGRKKKNEKIKEVPTTAPTEPVTHNQPRNTAKSSSKEVSTAEKNSHKATENNIDTRKKQENAILESTRMFENPQPPNPLQAMTSQFQPAAQPHLSTLTGGPSLMPSALDANSILSEAYTNTLQRQIFESINSFSNQLVNKIRIINDGINKKFMNDLATKYENLFNELRESFQSDVDEMCGFIADVKGLVNLPEEELIEYIKQNKFDSKNTPKP